MRAHNPDNLIRTILDGLQHPPSRQVGFMPAFKDALSDAQIADIVRYTRARYAPDERPWTGVLERVARLRQVPAP